MIQNGLPDRARPADRLPRGRLGARPGHHEVGDELEIAYPALAEEFRMIITETRAGKPRLEAFRNFASAHGCRRRAGARRHAGADRSVRHERVAGPAHPRRMSRTKRRQRAEERAAKIGVKLVFPLVFVSLPGVLRRHPGTGRDSIRAGVLRSGYEGSRPGDPSRGERAWRRIRSSCGAARVSLAVSCSAARAA